MSNGFFFSENNLPTPGEIFLKYFFIIEIFLVIFPKSSTRDFYKLPTQDFNNS